MEPPKSLPQHLLDAYVDWTNDLAWEGERTTTWRLTSLAGQTLYAKVGLIAYYRLLYEVAG